jgi:hypothetical protein
MKLLMESWRHYLTEDEKKSKEEEEYEPHMMYDPETGEGKKAEKYEDHTKLKEKGWDHEKPDLDEAAKKTGLWANIDAKEKRIEAGSGEEKAEPGDEGYPKTLDINEAEGEYYVDALNENEEYCPNCASAMEEAKEKKACKPSKGKRFAKRVDGKCRSYGQAGQAKSGGDRIRPGTKKGDAYCARSAGIKKCKNPPCANTLSRKKWKCRGKKSMKS